MAILCTSNRFYSLDPADINISSVGASCADMGARSQVTSEMCKTLLCAEARPTFSATNSIDTCIKTDPTRRIFISHYEYSELTVIRILKVSRIFTDLLFC